MNTYRVEVRAEAREVYYVEADSEQDALASWHEGILYFSENTNAEGASAELVEEG